MGKVMGRTDDMIKIKGANVFPSQVEAVLSEIEGTEPHYQIIVDRKGAVDELTVLVEVSESIFFDSMREQRKFIDLITTRLASELGITVEVKLVEKSTVERLGGKAQRIADNRRL
jgi:phenylacetate-CoA ligase